MTNQEALIALNMIEGVGPIRARHLIDSLGDAAAIVTLPRALIQEWVDYITINDIPETTSARPIREGVSTTTKYSTQLNSFESLSEKGTVIRLEFRQLPMVLN